MCRAETLDDALQRLFFSNEGFSDPGCGDLSFDIHKLDLNADGDDEAFVSWGNTCTSGAAERSLSLLIRSTQGQFTDHFGFPAAGYVLLENASVSYPDIEMTGPGFCFPVWRWTGDTYTFYCNRSQSDAGCQGRRNLCPDNLTSKQK